MQPVASHVTSRLEDDRVVLPSARARRELSRVVHEHGAAARLLAFSSGGDHLHYLFAGARDAAGEAVRRIEITLSVRHPERPGFQPARIRPVQDQAHLARAAAYVIRQPRRHGVESDPVLDANAAADLLGFRCVGSAMVRQFRELLPRATAAAIAAEVGLPAPPALASGVAEAIAVADVADAAAGALAVDLSRCGGRLRGRLLAAAARGAPPALVAAVRGQLWLRATLAKAAAAPSPAKP